MAVYAGKGTARRESSWNWFVRSSSKRPEAGPPWVELTYHGPKALSLTGPVSGARYHFGWHGATLPVDRRDAAELLLREDLRVHEQ
jgi:hypothetical protein